MRILLLLMFLSLAPQLSLAQISASGLSSPVQTDSTLVVYPSYPSPFEPYSVTLNDYGGTIYGAEINWYRNNALIPEAFNQRSITLSAGNSGSKDIIRADLKSSTGSQTLTTLVQPLYLDIIVEPQTHVPTFYAGRALASVGSTINVTALLNGTATGASQYIYTWRINDAVFEAGPLRGRNEISFVMTQNKSSDISLLVTSLNGTPLAKRSLSIPSVTPKLLFYEVSTLYGIEPRTLNQEFSLISNSATLRAEPYFLSSTVFNAPNIITWDVAGQDMGVLSDNPYEVMLQKTGFPGTTNIGFHVRSTDILLQGAKRSIRVSI